MKTVTNVPGLKCYQCARLQNPSMERFRAIKTHMLSKGIAEITFTGRSSLSHAPEPFIEGILSSFEGIDWSTIVARSDPDREALKTVRDNGRLRLVEAAMAYSFQQWMPAPLD